MFRMSSWVWSLAFVTISAGLLASPVGIVSLGDAEFVRLHERTTLDTALRLDNLAFTPVRAVELTIDAFDSGTLGSPAGPAGIAFVGPIWASVDENTPGCGCDLNCPCIATEFNNYFKFDLSDVFAEVISAQLVLEYPVGAHDVPPDDDSETEFFELHEITSDPDGFGFDFATSTVRPFSDIAYNDFADGQVFGGRNFSESDEGSLVAIPLNEAAVAAINAARGGVFSLGGTSLAHLGGLGTIKSNDVPPHLIFANTGEIETDPNFGFATIRQLVLTTTDDCGPPPGGDVIDLFDSSVLDVDICPDAVAGVQVDVDQDGAFDTQVVFLTLTGEAAVFNDASAPGKEYFFTFIDANCGGTFPFADKGRFVIRFVDMLAAGFVADDPTTWTFRSIPSLRVRGRHDLCTNGSATPFQLIQAFRNLVQTDNIPGTISDDLGPGPPFSVVRQFEFSDPAGIKELFVSTDFCENVLDDLILATQNTPCGIGVEVHIRDHTITFDAVTADGDTTITESSTGTAPAVNFQQACTPPQYFAIETETTFSGNIEICLSYDDTVCDESTLALLHNVGGTFVDVTTSLDTTANIICGIVTELSEFLLATPVQIVSVDLKPGSCPNSFNRNSHGVLPVAIVGSADFDAAMIDIPSVRLSRADGVGGEVAPNEGPPGPHPVLEDVATEFEASMECECDALGGDGITDLSMKFKTDDVVAALELNALPAGDLVPLVVTGTLLDGTPFETATDCIRLVPPGTPPGMLTVESNMSAAWLDMSPLDIVLDGGGFASFDRVFPQGTVVTLTAEATMNGRPLIAWRIDGVTIAATSLTRQIVITGATTTVRAIYRSMISNGPMLGQAGVNSGPSESQ